MLWQAKGLRSDDLGDVRVVRGDALDVIPQLPIVDAIVTSPPYADLREEVDAASPDGYADWLAPFLEAMLPILSPTGSLMLNLGRKFKDGVEHSYVERTLLRAEEIGWRRIDTIVWAKINGRPINPYLTNKHETVFWLTGSSRPGEVYRGFDDVRYPYSLDTLARYQRRWTKHEFRKTDEEPDAPVSEGRTANELGARPGSVYVTQIGKEKGIKHPSPMAFDLAMFLTCLSCKPGGLVLDPFFGSGTTARAAREHGCQCIGIERDDRYADEACEKLAQGALGV